MTIIMWENNIRKIRWKVMCWTQTESYQRRRSWNCRRSRRSRGSRRLSNKRESHASRGRLSRRPRRKRRKRRGERGKREKDKRRGRRRRKRSLRRRKSIISGRTCSLSKRSEISRRRIRSMKINSNSSLNIYRYARLYSLRISQLSSNSPQKMSLIAYRDCRSQDGFQASSMTEASSYTLQSKNMRLSLATSRPRGESTEETYSWSAINL